MASVFTNQVQTKDGIKTIKTIQLQKAYMDKNGIFQHTNSLNGDDLPKAIFVLTKAYEYILSNGNLSPEDKQGRLPDS